MVSSKTRSNPVLASEAEAEESALWLALAFLLLLRPFSRVVLARVVLAPPPPLPSRSLPLPPPLPRRLLSATLLPLLPRRALLAPLLPPLPLRLPSVPPLLPPALGRGVPSGIRRCGVKPPSFGRDQEQKAANRALAG